MPTNWQRVASKIARQEGVDPRLFRALISQESGWQPRVTSPAGAIGFTQLMPGTAEGLGVNPWKPRQNLRGGARYLSDQLERFGNVRLALSAYNSGPGGAEASGRVESFPETQNYVRSIMANYRGSGLAGGGGAVRVPQVTFDRAGYQDAVAQAVEEANRKQAALSLLGGSSYGAQGIGQPLLAAVGSQIAEQAEVDPNQFVERRMRNYNLPGGRNLRGAELMLAIIQMAQNRGLSARENPYVDPVDPVHTAGSFHDQLFPDRPKTRFDESQVGRGLDVSGAGLQRFLNRVIRRYGLGSFQEIFHDPWGQWDSGRYSSQGIGGHGTHVHFSI